MKVSEFRNFLRKRFFYIHILRFPLEMHLVHRNARYASLSEALGQADGLMVLGILFEIDPYSGMGEWLKGVQSYPMISNVSALTTKVLQLLVVSFYVLFLLI